MSFSNKLLKSLTNILPSPFSIAIILTSISFIAAFFLTPVGKISETPVFDILGFWETGFWDLLKFGMQMMLMLVLGHTLALTKPVDKLVRIFSQSGTNTANAAFTVTFFTIIVSLFNWGLGLIFGAVFARKKG
ncbi:MAG: TIGR00366 family protein, partial [Bacteroidales bacterium]|nr:TIGR00366 family protein [Bacteroidales bacterium]